MSLGSTWLEGIEYLLRVVYRPSHQAAIGPRTATRIQDEERKFNSNLLIKDLTKQVSNPIDTVTGHLGNQ
ncbi:hypothetical protein [Pseudomonas chlororaphis]|uniref:hypothetical protein n=1 Tax=Pseudomonas chlororaphis TaxID=587753 RepID=UPI001B30A7BE|nr:hypothetical protein [Pseudomonas chlororaphis]QTT89377.1 hypothetical protein HUT28_18995 [Pseudomonas chlororaphis]